MKLLEFRVLNYRSVNDSGQIEVRPRTALVGRNESGKSNLLLALKSLNPPDGMKPLSFVKDYPRDRLKSSFSEDLEVVSTQWELDINEQSELARVFPRASGVSQITVSRSFEPQRTIQFADLRHLCVDETAVQDGVLKLQKSVHGALHNVEESVTVRVKNALAELVATAQDFALSPAAWATAISTGVNRYHAEVNAVGFSLPDRAKERLDTLRQYADVIQTDAETGENAKQWVEQHLPVFIYLDEYPELNGHQNISEYIQRKNQRSLTAADSNFEKLVKVADLDPGQLQSLLSQSHEERQQLTNRASAVVTKTIRDLWSDRALKIRFNVDAEHFDTLVSDPNSLFDVEVNLDERSRGFRWFFSFYITFAADTAGGPAANAILLLDEPGLFLHATSQRDLLDHFAKDFKNQIVYTTHSPFMVPVDDLSSIRTVNIDEEAGTVVTNDPTGDSRTLFPLQAALGYDLIQSMFIGQHNLVVEGVSDYWYLSSVSEHLRESGTQSLPSEVVITPAGGAQKVGFMATLLAAQRLDVLVLFDDEKDARRSSEKMVHSKLIRSDSAIFVSEAFTGPNAPPEADIEDLVDEDVFAALVQETYRQDLEGRSLTLNDHIPRIVKRYEAAFRELGLEFHKTRPAKLFLRRIADAPESVMTAASQDRFVQLFSIVSNRLHAQAQQRRKPFA